MCTSVTRVKIIIIQIFFNSIILHYYNMFCLMYMFVNFQAYIKTYLLDFSKFDVFLCYTLKIKIYFSLFQVLGLITQNIYILIYVILTKYYKKYYFSYSSRKSKGRIKKWGLQIRGSLDIFWLIYLYYVGISFPMNVILVAHFVIRSYTAY